MGESKREAEFFDALADAHGEFNPFEPRGWRTLRNAFERLIHCGGRPVLLDVGCGTGQSRQIYIDCVGRYLGVDLSFRGLQMARRSFPMNLWIHADAAKLPVTDGSIDIVAFSSVLHHVGDY